MYPENVSEWQYKDFLNITINDYASIILLKNIIGE